MRVRDLTPDQKLQLELRQVEFQSILLMELTLQESLNMIVRMCQEYGTTIEEYLGYN